MNPAPVLPRSAVPLRQGLAGLVGCLAALAVMVAFKLGPLFGIWLMIACCSVPMLTMEKAAEPSAELDRRLLWALKLFFIPVYTVGLFWNLTYFTLAKGFLAFVLGAYAIDVTFVLVGYLFASARTFHSVQPLGLGWIVCLVCYRPIIDRWAAASAIGLNEQFWPKHAGQGLLVIIMASLLALYFSSTIVFGTRGSNLGYRGVITGGPYRLMKHPAYFCHVAFGWIAVLFFLPFSYPMILAAAVFTIIYRLRAATEEKHLRGYPQYVAYCEWVEQNGLLARAMALGPARRKSQIAPLAIAPAEE